MPPQTRAQAHAETNGESPPSSSATTQKTKSTPEGKHMRNGEVVLESRIPDPDSNDAVPKKRHSPLNDESPKDDPSPAIEHHLENKRQKNEASAEPEASKLGSIISRYGAVPLSDLGLSHPLQPTGETILAHIFNALLSSGRIEHEVANKTLKCLVEDNYHEFETMKKSSWDERTEILTKGGYTHYREQTATYLGDLITLIDEKYQGDASKILPETSGSSGEVQKELSDRLQEIKGLGPLGTEIFLETVQGIYPAVSPYMSKRNLEAAEEMGLGSLDEMWEGVVRDAKKMSMLCVGIANLRLDGRKEHIKKCA